MQLQHLPALVEALHSEDICNDLGAPDSALTQAKKRDRVFA
jgi:hypothetical protein